jgi:hypothetical protein
MRERSTLTELRRDIVAAVMFAVILVGAWIIEVLL